MQDWPMALISDSGQGLSTACKKLGIYVDNPYI